MRATRARYSAVARQSVSGWKSVAKAASAFVIVSRVQGWPTSAASTAAARFAGEVEQVRLLTPDKDLGQCVRGRKVVQVDRRQEKEFDEEGVRAKLGVLPASVPDLLARTLSGEIEPGRVFDLTLPLDEVAEGYRAMDERRAIKVLLDVAG